VRRRILRDRLAWWTAHLGLPLLYGPPLRMRRRGHENIPRSGATLIVCNHVSVADPLVAVAGARPRRVWLMSKSELFANPVASWLITSMRAFPVERSKADFGAMRLALRLLDAGGAVVVYPEGHVSRTGHMRRGNPGAGMLAMRTGAVVIPAVTWDTQLFRGPARIVFGPPIDLGDIPAIPRKARNREATDRIMRVLHAMVLEVGGPPQDPPVGPVRPEDRKRGRVTPATQIGA
jgi:1-acyl-sn-glycerol-3-phosphate acyltransferase